MKVYLVEERGYHLGESCMYNLAVCATKERAIEFLNNRKTYVEAVNPQDRCTWVFEERESADELNIIYVLTYVSDVYGELIDYLVCEMDVLE